MNNTTGKLVTPDEVAGLTIEQKADLIPLTNDESNELFRLERRVDDAPNRSARRKARRRLRIFRNKMRKKPTIGQLAEPLIAEEEAAGEELEALRVKLRTGLAG